MTRRTYRLLIFIAQVAVIVGLGTATLWNILGALTALTPVGWWGLLLPLPGLLLWGGTLIAPDLLARLTPLPDQAFRLVYTTPDAWSDDTVRAALRNLAQAVGGMGITWARDGDGIGCWVSVPAGADVLHRMAQDIFPTGYFEPDTPPFPTEGVTVLRWRDTVPAPVELCRYDGVDGVYIFWQDDRRAIVSVWGDNAVVSMRVFAAKADLLPDAGSDLIRSRFRGQNPYPDFPPFPPSGDNPGLAAVSNFEKTEPGLRVSPPALVLGYDRTGEAVGFPLPALTGIRPARVVGEHSAVLTAELVRQALSRGLRVFLFDGDGAVITRLTKTAMRELASGRALLCDLDRPAQSKFRLNPLWLPDDPHRWAETLHGWQQWQAEMGITPAGLGKVTVQHTFAAVALIAFAARERGLGCDPVSLRDTLNTPDILPALSLPAGVLDPEIWRWWQSEGRHTPNFDAHLRLSHLRDRLTQWLTIPEYRVLWRTPYDDATDLLARRTALLWRVPDPTGFRRAYINSQLLALTNLLRTLPADEPPALVVLHRLNPGFWGERLHALPGARLLAADAAGETIPVALSPQTLVISRLNRAAAARLAPHLNVRESDLRRLPPGRLIIKRGRLLGTADAQIVKNEE